MLRPSHERDHDDGAYFHLPDEELRHPVRLQKILFQKPFLPPLCFKRLFSKFPRFDILMTALEDASALCD